MKRPTLETKADQVVRDTRLGQAYKIDKKKLSTILVYLAKWHTIGLLWADRELLAASLDRAIEALLDKPNHLSRWRLLRKDSGLLLGQAARELKIGVVELSAIETGKADPSEDLIMRMKKLYKGRSYYCACKSHDAEECIKRRYHNAEEGEYCTCYCHEKENP